MLPMLEKWKSLVQYYNIEDTIFALLVHTCNTSLSDCVLCLHGCMLVFQVALTVKFSSSGGS